MPDESPPERFVYGNEVTRADIDRISDQAEARLQAVVTHAAMEATRTDQRLDNIEKKIDEIHKAEVVAAQAQLSTVKRAIWAVGLLVLSVLTPAVIALLTHPH